MAAAGRTNVSEDLIWEIVRSQNSFLVKRNSGGGARFSRDPLNLTNVHSRKVRPGQHLVQLKPLTLYNPAIGVQAGENNGLTISTKRPGNANQPGKNVANTSISGSTNNRKVYKGVANRAVSGGYRPDLRAEAVSRVSAIRLSQRPKKDTPEKKLRGAKARKAAQKDE
ncbi:hypothetical protein PRK78_007367 [Emydomyces testavorans]|uniref:Ribosomal eL28/Mak16 domain-containing protein n=1 Tax=Emydomyces testavorans TaxID=2070801 RepID=A0AAF0ILD0_9EURO|nr:hypothetical protein PRK78_007367 [Emydomyces testavorans]